MLITDFRGLTVRLESERLVHILEHPEMKGMEPAIEETLEAPEQVVESASDPLTHLYYRYYYGTLVGNKHVCVVVKILEEDAFVLTAYLTDQVKKGNTVWPKST